MAFTSPNFDERNSPVSILVLHYTGMKSGREALERLCDPLSKVSAHYVLEEDGTLHNLVDESKRAWHAGISYWRGLENLNTHSIGIEIVNPGHEFGYREFTKAQYYVLVPLCQQIKARHNIQDINIIGHSDIAPERKADPGELFDWALLAKNGVGLHSSCHTRPERVSGYPLRAGMTLVELGYREHNKASIAAFQRHWRQSKVDGVWDDECAGILGQLLTLV